MERQEHPATEGTDSCEINSGIEINTSVVFVKVGQSGVKEKLGSFQRISVITFILFSNCVLLSLSAFCLFITVWSDCQWQKITTGEKSFGKLSIPKTITYFEGKKLKELPLGRVILSRKQYINNSVHYEWERYCSGSFHIVQACCMIVCLLFCFVHLAVLCCVRRVRRAFQLISLGYGFVGLFVLTLCLTTLYFAFVHKVSSYLANALNPPDPADFNPPVDNVTIDYFVNLSYACAFAFSKSNKFANGSYSPYWPFPDDSSFTIENSTYTREELMELGICPKQDYLLISSFLLAVTTAFCWTAASYSEHLENEIIGPPIWLQRFKIKIHKGVRHWKTRTTIPDHHNLNKEKGLENQYHRPHPHEIMKINSPPDDDNFVDAYRVLDGGADHILLTCPITDLGASTQKLYQSSSAISVFDKTQVR